ncbi:hypothetical protein [Chroococcidiopsis thermalis]|nr:hypothetical protein [Chroococcidiopsis thermalis]
MKHRMEGTRETRRTREQFKKFKIHSRTTHHSPLIPDSRIRATASR